MNSRVSLSHSQQILIDKYSKILQNHGIDREIRVVDVDESPPLPVHFTSHCHFVTIHFCDNLCSKSRIPVRKLINTSANCLELFVKTLKGNAEIKDEEEFSLFDKESNFYLGVLPELRKVCLEKTGSMEILNLFPKVYYASDNVIVMENLVKQNYIMLDRELQHSFQEARSVMKGLARFHSVSFALIQEIGLEAFQKKFPHTRERMMKRDGVGYEINTMMIDSIIRKLVNLLQESNLPNSTLVVDKLSKYQEIAFSTMCDIVEEKQMFHVLNHGDVWSNNIFFKKDKNDNLTQLKFVDFQMTRVGSPNLDISYYFYNTVHSKVRKSQLKSLLEIYFTEFVRNLSRLGVKCDFCFDDFLRDHGKIGKLGFLYGVYIAAASPLMGKVDLEGSENWIEDYVSAIRLWLDNNQVERNQVLSEVVSMVETFIEFGEL